jgi:hypothetical protein
MNKIELYEFVGIIILLYSVTYLSIRFIVINDFTKRKFENKEIKILWRKRLYSFTRSQIGVIAYFIHFIVKSEKN